jgi:cytochrome b561
MTSRSIAENTHLISHELRAPIQCAILIGGQLSLGFATFNTSDLALKTILLLSHTLLGVVIFGLALRRVIRLWATHNMTIVSSIKTHLMQVLDYLFYVLLMVMALSGIGMTVSRGILAVPVSVSEPLLGILQSGLQSVHATTAPVLALVFAVHLAIAVYRANEMRRDRKLPTLSHRTR